MVEMRDTQAFQIELGVEYETFSKVSLEEFVILRFEKVEPKRVAAFLDGVDNSFKFSKHRLPE